MQNTFSPFCLLSPPAIFAKLPLKDDLAQWRSVAPLGVEVHGATAGQDRRSRM